MFTCNICNNNFTGHNSLLYHVKKEHILSTQEYYDLVYNAGLCKTCGKPTRFINFKAGYKQYCSAKCAANSSETIRKREETNLKKYGCKNISQNTEIKQRKVNTYMQHVNETKEKIKQTNRQRYGCDWVTQSNNFKEKAAATCIEKYNVDNYAKTDTYKEKLRNKSEQNIQYMIDNGYIPLVEINSKYGTGWAQQNHDKVTIYKNKGYIHKSLIPEIEQYSSRVNSKFQQEVFDFIGMDNTIQNTRKIIAPYELDIYSPDLKLAIECDGLYWHANNDSKYHLMKTEMCNKLGIRLIHITDWQWHNQQDIIKSILNAALNRYETKIYARKCIIKNVSNKDTKEFLKNNHIQGSVNASTNIGLYYNDELIQLITLGKSRYKKDEYELYRMCTKLNTQVIGGFTRLLAQINKPIVSYVDRSLFTGEGYEKTGWTKLYTTPPSYAYYKQNIKLNRTQTQKHKLQSLLSTFDPNLSEKQNMINNNWSIMYDCGTIKFMKGN